MSDGTRKQKVKAGTVGLTWTGLGYVIYIYILVIWYVLLYVCIYTYIYIYMYIYIYTYMIWNDVNMFNRACSRPYFEAFYGSTILTNYIYIYCVLRILNWGNNQQIWSFMGITWDDSWWSNYFSFSTILKKIFPNDIFLKRVDNLNHIVVIYIYIHIYLYNDISILCVYLDII